MIRAFTIALLFIAATAARAAEDVAVNGTFEEDVGWQFMAANGCQATAKYDEIEHHSGKRSYFLTNTSQFAPHVYGRIFQVTRGLKPFTTYRISAWVKGKNIGLAWVGGGPGWALRQAFPKGTYNWQQVHIDYATDDQPPDFELMVALEDPTEALWVDDVLMTEISSDTARREKSLAKVTTQLREYRSRVRALQQRAGSNTDPFVKLGVSIATRFLDRIEKPAPHVRQSLGWSMMQLDEIREVLDQTEKLAKSGPRGTPVTQPKYLNGYGHFGAVIRDLPNFRSFGATLIQDGRLGPSGMNERGELNETAAHLGADLDAAARAGMKVDILLSPHYFPDWAVKKAPDLLNGNAGFIGFNIDHPVAREVMEQWVATISPQLENKPSLHSICLSNEPVYVMSGRDKFSRPLFAKFLQDRHKTINGLNSLYGTSSKNFDEVAPPNIGLPNDENARRAYFDWVSFNNQHFADWHAWLRDVVHAKLPEIPVHAKEMVFFAFDRDKLHFGIDPELICGATDIAGCDAYAFLSGGEYPYDWHGHEFWYDLLHSFRGQGVFNSENHLIPDGSPPAHHPAAHTRAAIWQGGLHHQTATTIWVWEEPSEQSLSGSIYLRPAAIYGAGRAMIDLNRFAAEVDAINSEKPRIALLYSPASVFWEEKYAGTIHSIYTMLNFLGEKVTFVSERQLAEKKAPPIDFLIVPNATHVTVATGNALTSFHGRVLLVGRESLRWDEYHRQHDGAAQRESWMIFHPQKDQQATAKSLHDLLSALGLRLHDLIDDSGKPAWGIEYRVIEHNGGQIVPMINLTTKPMVVRLAAGGDATDLLSQESIDTTKIALEPMVPRLLRVDRR